MLSILKTLTRDGSFCFYSTLVEISKYDCRYKHLIEQVLSSSPRKLDDYGEVEVYSLFLHEYTHFLDFTTTAWGLEFLLRKKAVVEAIENSKGVDEKLEVLMLNLSELYMHSEFLEIFSNVSLNDCIMEHSFDYTSNHGAIVIVCYKYEGSAVLNVPVSMLSLIESNAYANEYLAKIKFIESTNSEEKMFFLEKDLEEELADTNLSEYTFFITLCRRHFPYLSTKECLTFWLELSRCVLNMNNILSSLLADFLIVTIENKEVGAGICHDLRRNMSRHFIAFKLVLLIHGIIEEADDDKRNYLVEILKTNPRRAFHIVFDEYNLISSSVNMANAIDEFEILYEIAIKESQDCSEVELFNSFLRNYVVLSENEWIDISLKELELMDAFLSDGTVITAPKRIDVNIEDYYDRLLDGYIAYENLCDKKVIEKFHFHPRDIAAIINIR